MVIVTELLLGGTLRKYLLNLRPKCLDIHVAIGFALDIARAMECLHSHGIIHRDLKPGKESFGFLSSMSECCWVRLFVVPMFLQLYLMLKMKNSFSFVK